MADPLSVAASIAGLASLGDLLFRKLYHWIKSVRGADKEVIDLKDEIGLLNGVLHNLVLVARDLEAESNVSYTVRPAHVNTCLALLHKIDDELTKIGISGPGQIAKHLEKLAWPFKNIKLKHYIEDLRRQRDNLNTAVNADSFKALLQSLSKQEDISKQLTNVEALLQKWGDVDTRIKLDEERQKVLDYFLFVDPQPSFQTSVQLRCATTGFWLTEDETFCQWNNSTQTVLWMSGIPGAGKTLLSGLVVQGCMARASDDHAVAFFYCDYKNPESQKTVHVLGSLASQIARQNESSFEALKQYYLRLKPRDRLSKEPEALELVDVIQTMSSSFQDVRVVVDGLDECGDNAGSITEILSTLNNTDRGSISLALFSRNETDIERAMTRRDHAHIEIAAKSKDLDHYVRSEIEHRIDTGDLYLGSNQIKDEIIHQLVTRADGMFRWVACQLDHLCELPTDKERRLALQRLPKTLHESYERILLRLQSPPIISLVKKSLRWIAYASPRLDVEQLIDVLSLDEEQPALDDENRPNPDYIFKHCASLIRNRQGYPELAHFTVLEYLETIDLDKPRLSQFRLCHRIDKCLLDSVCTMYISASNFNIQNATISTRSGFEYFNSRYPFHKYAAASNSYQSWPLENTNEPNFLNHFSRLFHPKVSFNVHLIILQRLYRFGGRRPKSIATKVCSPSFGPLHAAAMLHWEQMCRWLLRKGYDINEESSWGAPLQCALFGCQTRHEQGVKPTFEYPNDAVRLLLSEGANCNAVSTRHKSLSLVAALWPITQTCPFFEVLKSGMPLHEDTLRMLKNYPPVNWAHEVYEFLQSSGAHQITDQTRWRLLSTLPPGRPTTPLLTPSASMLTDDEFFGAVEFTVRFGHERRFKELACDSRLSSNSEEIITLACIAAGNESGIMMQLLLGLFPETVTKLNYLGQSCWHVASSCGSEDVLRVLLEHKEGDLADLHIRCRRGMTPILSAIYHYKEYCALLLIKALIDTEAYVSDFEVLSWATAYGMDNFLGFLIRNEFDFSTKNETSCTALFFITTKTSARVVDILLEKGLCADWRCETGKTALNSLLSLETGHYDNYLKALGEHDWRFPPIATIKKIATSSSVALADNAGHLPWFYLCSVYIPQLFNHYSPIGELSLEELLLCLIRLSACNAYDESTSMSGISLLIKSLLDLDLDIKSEKISRQWDGYISAAVRAVLDSDMAPWCRKDDPQLIRLAIWSLQHEDRRHLLTLLLDKNLDIYSPSYYYADQSVFDVACSQYIPLDCMQQLLGVADVSELSRPVNSSRWARHIFDNHEVFKKEALMKLDLILSHGVDPDSIVGPETGVSIIIEAAARGFLEIVQLLKRHGADLRQTDAFGRDINTWVVRSGNLALVQYLFTGNTSTEHWRLRHRMPPRFKYVSSLALNAEGCNLFHIAAAHTSPAMLQFLEETSLSDIFLETSEGYTALQLAVWAHNLENVKWLLNKHVDIDLATRTCKNTALHIAMAGGDVAIIIALIEAKAQFLGNAAGMTPELMARTSTRSELLGLLPYCGVDIPSSVLQNLKSFPNLFEAISSGNVSSCQEAITQGCIINKPFNCGCTPLVLALGVGIQPIVDLLLDRGARNVDGICTEAHYRPANVVNYAATHERCNFMLAELLLVFLEHVDHWIHEPVKHWHTAAAYNPEAVVIILEHMCAHPRLYAKYTLFTSVYRAEKDFKKAILNWPVESIINDSELLLCGEGETALHIAVGHGQLDVVKMLLEHGADLDARRWDRATPLHIAACIPSTDISKLLIAHGASIRLRDAYLRTPFLLACMTNSPNIDVLIDPAIDSCITDHRGKGALHYVAEQSNLQLFIRFVELGWDPHLKLTYDDTPLMVAAWKDSQLATYIRASIPQLERVKVPKGTSSRITQRGMTINGLRHLCRYVPLSDRQRGLQDGSDAGLFSLSLAAGTGNVSRMDVLLQAGADLEFAEHYYGAALIMARTVGQLGAVRYLIRRGASLYSTLDGRDINAIQAAEGNHNILSWLLVGRYTEQTSITNTDSDKEPQLWSGIRQIEIPLKGCFRRETGISLFVFAIWLRAELRIKTWRRLVPLNWDPSPQHFVPLPVVSASRASELLHVLT